MVSQEKIFDARNQMYDLNNKANIYLKKNKGRDRLKNRKKIRKLKNQSMNSQQNTIQKTTDE